jgi:hypothetical protein
MAARGGERRLVFDVRGRRRHVVRFVYAILALLMMSSLFFVVGPFNLGSLIGRGGTTSAAKVLDEQAERIERRLARDPKNEALLLSLTRTRISAGNARIERDPTTGTQKTPPEARAEYEQGMRSWSRYLAQAGSKPSPTAALLVAGTYFSLAQAAPSGAQIESNVKKAAATQRIAAEATPSIGSLSTLAIYEYFSGHFAAGDRAARQAELKAPSKMEAKSVEKQMVEYRKRGEEYEKQKRQLAKLEKKKGKEALQNPLGGLGSPGTGLGP